MLNSCDFVAGWPEILKLTHTQQWGSTQKWKGMSSYSFVCRFSRNTSFFSKMFWTLSVPTPVIICTFNVQYFDNRCAVLSHPMCSTSPSDVQYLRKYKGILPLDVKVLHIGCAMPELLPEKLGTLVRRRKKYTAHCMDNTLACQKFSFLSGPPL